MPAEQTPARIRTPLAVARLLLIWLAIILLGLELGLRAAGFSFYWAFTRYPDEYRGVAILPGTQARQDLEGHAWIRINRYGFRDRDWPEKPAGTWRIAVLGDSFTAAVQVPLEQTWWQQVMSRLNDCGYRDRPVEILNFAVSGYGTAQQLETLRHHVAQHTPDEIWLTFFPGNDITDNHPELNDDPLRPYLRPVGDAWQMDYGFRELPEYRSKNAWWGHVYYTYLIHARVVQGLALVRSFIKQGIRFHSADRMWEWEPGIDARVYAPPVEPAWQEAWEATRRLLQMVRNEAASLDTELRVLGLSTGAQLYTSDERIDMLLERLGVPDPFYPNWQLARFAAQDGYDYIDLARPLAERAGHDGTVFHGFGDADGMGHWNADGHAAAADLLATALCDGSTRQ